MRLKSSGTQYALKVIDKHLVLRHRCAHRVARERNILDRCHHPAVASLFFTFQDETSAYMGLELCSNGGFSPEPLRRHCRSILMHAP